MAGRVASQLTTHTYCVLVATATWTELNATNFTSYPALKNRQYLTIQHRGVDTAGTPDDGSAGVYPKLEILLVSPDITPSAENGFYLRLGDPITFKIDDNVVVYFRTGTANTGFEIVESTKAVF
jgi:hypothetical protein